MFIVFSVFFFLSYVPNYWKIAFEMLCDVWRLVHFVMEMNRLQCINWVVYRRSHHWVCATGGGELWTCVGAANTHTHTPQQSQLFSLSTKVKLQLVSCSLRPLICSVCNESTCLLATARCIRCVFVRCEIEEKLDVIVIVGDALFRFTYIECVVTEQLRANFFFLYFFFCLVCLNE